MSKAPRSNSRKSDVAAASSANNRAAVDFHRHAGERPPGFFSELIYMLRQNKQWWLVPILVTLLVVGALVFLGGTAAAPFIYSLF
jgi:hypothetical protein